MKLIALAVAHKLLQRSLQKSLHKNCYKNYMTYAPPKSCIPNKAKIRMNKKSRNIKLMIDLMLLSNDVIKFFNDDQYLKIFEKLI